MTGDHPHPSPALSHAVAFGDTVVHQPPHKQTAKEIRPCTWLTADEGETAWAAGLCAGLAETSTKQTGHSSLPVSMIHKTPTRSRQAAMFVQNTSEGPRTVGYIVNML